MPERNRRRLELPVQKRQGEGCFFLSFLFFPFSFCLSDLAVHWNWESWGMWVWRGQFWHASAVLFVCAHAAAHRLRNLLQNLRGRDWSRAAAVHPLRPQISADRGPFDPSWPFVASDLTWGLCWVWLSSFCFAGHENHQSWTMPSSEVQIRHADSSLISWRQLRKFNTSKLNYSVSVLSKLTSMMSILSFFSNKIMISA